MKSSSSSTPISGRVVVSLVGCCNPKALASSGIDSSSESSSPPDSASSSSSDSLSWSPRIRRTLASSSFFSLSASSAIFSSSVLVRSVGCERLSKVNCFKRWSYSFSGFLLSSRAARSGFIDAVSSFAGSGFGGGFTPLRISKRSGRPLSNSSRKSASSSLICCRSAL